MKSMMFLLKKLSSNFDKKTPQPIDSIEKKAYGINKDLVRKKKEIKCKKIMKQYKNV